MNLIDKIIELFKDEESTVEALDEETVEDMPKEEGEKEELEASAE